MNHLRGAILFVAAAFVQWWWSAHWSFWGLSPQILLVLTMTIAARRGPNAGMGYGFLWGLFLDTLQPRLFGANAFALMLTGYGTGMARRQIDVVDALSQCLLVLLMSWGYFLVLGLLGMVFVKSFWWAGWGAFLCDPLYNCCMIPAASVCWQWLRSRP
ncbi:MAG: rod shape-determining protein MreD [Elusimicrobia bacterium]|nr:rod shape-determining protein MreD [Elusimicrobiota bacterium]